MTPEQTAQLRGIMREMRLDIQGLLSELQLRQEARGSSSSDAALACAD